MNIFIIFQFLIPASFALPSKSGSRNLLEGEGGCSCNGYFDENEEGGHCNIDWPVSSKEFWCYVNEGSCSDAEERQGNYWSYDACNNYTTGLIILHGLTSVDGLECNEIKKGLNLGRSVKVVCPSAEPDPNLCLLEIEGASEYIGVNPRSWYNTCGLPGEEAEDKSDLDAAVERVEGYIEDLIANDGIGSENIVLAGVSQGGSLALYTALHSKYKLGGFIGVVTWLPLNTAENPSESANADTPVFHINALNDFIVPQSVGRKTEKELSKVISDYTFELVEGAHGTIHKNNCSWEKVTNWLADKKLLELDHIPTIPTCHLNVTEAVDDFEGKVADSVVDITNSTYDEVTKPIDNIADNRYDEDNVDYITDNTYEEVAETADYMTALDYYYYLTQYI